MSETLARLLLPGTLCDARLYQPLCQQWALAGEVATPTVADFHSLGDDPARWWQMQLDRMSSPMDVIGFSLGGILAMQLLALQPQRVRRLVLIASNPMPGNSTLIARIQQQQQVWRTQGPQVLASQMLQQANGPHLPHPAVLQCVQAMAQSTPATAFDAQCHINMHRPDGCLALAAWSGPLMLISGAADPWCGPDKQRLMLQARPDAQWHELPGAGHYLPLEHAEVIAPLIQAFFH